MSKNIKVNRDGTISPIEPSKPSEYSEFQEMTPEDYKILMESPIKKIDGVVFFETTEEQTND